MLKSKLLELERQAKNFSKREKMLNLKKLNIQN